MGKKIRRMILRPVDLVDLRSWSVKRLRTYRKHILATMQNLFDSGWCCEAHCTHEWNSDVPSEEAKQNSLRHDELRDYYKIIKKMIEYKEKNNVLVTVERNINFVA